MSHQPFFAPSFLKENLQLYRIDDIPNLQQKKQIISDWIRSIENGSIYSIKETSVDVTFLDKFFGDVLGYDYNWATGKCNLVNKQTMPSDGKEADGALGYFSIPEKAAQYVTPLNLFITADIRVVIELKGARIPLDKKQNRTERYTPVEQAFQYASKAGGNCKWVIVSNFLEIRLYRANDQNKYEKFEIKKLAKEDELKRFFYLLSYGRLFLENSISVIEKLFDERQIIERKISENFYKQYKLIRFQLFEHLKSSNSNYQALEILEKTQKLLDRIIFICFCEDFFHIPHGTLDKLFQTYKNSFESSDTNLWNQLKGLFKSMDKGATSPLKINKFNGGLFADDNKLDQLIIKNNVLEKAIKLYEYDFQSELNVNILGHIFEQSITDIEEIKRQIEAENKSNLFEKQDDNMFQQLGELPVETRSSSKRKKDGIFYTPEYITNYIVKETIINGWLEDRKQEIGFYDLPELTDEDYDSINANKSNTKVLAHIKSWETIQQRLLNIKVLDPACGSGAFLNKVFDVLKEENLFISRKLSELKGEPENIHDPSNPLDLMPKKFDIDNHILTHNIFGVDLNNESIEITRLSLWLKTAKSGNVLSTIENNIQLGNSLVDDSSVAGDLAFNWNIRFKEIMAAGGFDAVVGNPPYITYHGRRRILIDKEDLNYYRDHYDCILDKKIDGKYNSLMFFIEKSIKLCKAYSYIGLICDISFFEHFYDGVKKYLLENTSIRNIITGLSSFVGVGSGQVIIITSKIKDLNKNNIVNWISNGLDGESTLVLQDKWNNEDKHYQFQIAENDNISSSIIDKVEANTLKLEELFPNKLIRTGESIGIKEKGFVLDEYPKKDSVEIYDYLEGASSLPNRYSILIPTRFFRYDVALLNNRNDEYRKEAEKLKRNPKVLGIGDKEAFNNPKILIRQSCDHLCASYSKKRFIYNRSFYSINNVNSSGVAQTNLIFILALLNSKLFTYYSRIKRIIRMEHGKQPQIRLGDLKAIPIKKLTEQKQNPFIKKADEILIKKQELEEIKRNFLELLISDFKLEDPSAKLKNWIELNWNEVEKELKKFNLTIKGKEKKEWFERFTRFKKQAEEIQSAIKQTDQEIDEMVYELYGLTEEEIKIVEG